MATTVTRLFSVASVPLVDDQLVIVPATGGAAIPQGTYKALRLMIGLSLADKLAVGKTLQVSAFFSSDSGASWQFINRIDWISYGPGGLTVKDPDGTVHVNPDPTLGVPLNSVTPGMLMHVEYIAHGLATASVVIDGLS